MPILLNLVMYDGMVISKVRWMIRWVVPGRRSCSGENYYDLGWIVMVGGSSRPKGSRKTSYLIPIRKAEVDLDLNPECHKRGNVREDWRDQGSTKGRVELYHPRGRKEPTMNYRREWRIYSENFARCEGILGRLLSRFAKNVMVDDLPASFSPITFEYDATSDPCDHVCRFENTALLLGWGKMPSVRYYADQVCTYLVQLVRWSDYLWFWATYCSLHASLRKFT